MKQESKENLKLNIRTKVQRWDYNYFKCVDPKAFYSTINQLPIKHTTMVNVTGKRDFNPSESPGLDYPVEVHLFILRKLSKLSLIDVAG